MKASAVKVIIIGTNDNATACALRLFRAGFHVSLVSKKLSSDLYYFRNFSPILSMGTKEIYGVKAESFADFLYKQQSSTSSSIQKFIDFLNNDRKISALSEEDLKQIKLNQFNFCIICDSILFKNIYVEDPAFITISCVKGIATHYSIVNSGPYAGNVDYNFLNFPSADEVPDTNLIYSEKEGVFIAEKKPGEQCSGGERIAKIDEVHVLASNAGFIEGIMQSGLIIEKNIPIISICNHKKNNPKILPDKSFSIAGGVLEVIMFHQSLNRV